MQKKNTLLSPINFFSTAEANYLNYYLNNSSYTNALALRNKYEHPKKLIINSQELISDYIKGLKILSLIIIKINDELCIKYPETRKNWLNHGI